VAVAEILGKLAEANHLLKRLGGKKPNAKFEITHKKAPRWLSYVLRLRFPQAWKTPLGWT
jgi:hypothetical protein